jgi:glycine cleavage system H protein
MSSRGDILKVMSRILGDLKYAKTHEWVKLEEPGVVRIGITDFAQRQLGDVVFVELPTIGQRMAAGESAAVVESVKAASDIYSPVTGEILEINTSLSETPEAINEDPYAAWIFQLKVDHPLELEALLSAMEYENLVNAHE